MFWGAVRGAARHSDDGEEPDVLEAAAVDERGALAGAAESDGDHPQRLAYKMVA
jgi:hypothetical protein